jgi:hypothetical protein
MEGGGTWNCFLENNPMQSRSRERHRGEARPRPPSNARSSSGRRAAATCHRRGARAIYPTLHGVVLQKAISVSLPPHSFRTRHRCAYVEFHQGAFRMVAD